MIANVAVKKMGLQGLFIEDFEDKPIRRMAENGFAPPP